MRFAHFAAVTCALTVICAVANCAVAEATPQNSDDTAPVATTDAAAAASSIPSNVANAVVKVFSTMRYPDPYRPWTKQAPAEATASGVIIEGKRILTNAHAVLYASQVQIQPNQSGDKISATVIAVAPGIDLAVLKLDDESFFNTHAPIARAAELPQIKDAVLATDFRLEARRVLLPKGSSRASSSCRTTFPSPDCVSRSTPR